MSFEDEEKELDESEVLEVIRRHARQLAIQSGGKAQFRDVMLSLGKELDREQVRTLIPVIKQEIENINNKSLDELKEDEEEDEPSMVENEYDELASNMKERFENKSYVQSLIAYGSYGKNTHIMGQSNLNFLLVLKDLDQVEEESVGKEIQEIIESLMNPLFEYLLDIVILFNRNVQSLENFQSKMGPGFSMIHAFSASQSTSILGDNPFKTFNFTGQLASSAEMILKDTIQQYQKAKTDITNNPENSPTNNKEDLAYLSSEAIIDLALALIYLSNKTSQLENITKPEIRDKFPEVFAKNKRFAPFISTVDKSFAYRLGITKIGESEQIVEEDLVKGCEDFIVAIEEFLKK